ITPCLPHDWPGYRLHYRYRDTMYRIAVTQGAADGVTGTVTVDGVLQENGVIVLVDDKESHVVEIGVSARLDSPPV
ncbi:MAG: glycosyl hydrolase family 65 protein, partial [Oxalobacteraceae bacterium]